MAEFGLCYIVQVYLIICPVYTHIHLSLFTFAAVGTFRDKWYISQIKKKSLFLRRITLIFRFKMLCF